jgi:Argininosuccinate lyase
LKSFHKKIEKDVFDCLSLHGSVVSRDHIGGTAPAQVREAVNRGRQRLETIMSED